MISILSRHRVIFIYGVALAMVLSLFHWLEMGFLLRIHASELYLGGIAVMFTGLGIWLALKLSSPKIQTVIIEKEVRVTSGEFVFNEAAFISSGISQRELEVLQLMSAGLSNQEIAERLFVSLNTVKTHISGVFSKLGVKRRTQAVEVAKRLNIIA